MEFIELANKRYSLRDFSSKKVEKEKIDKILEAGNLAPTAKNLQPQKILVLDDEKQLDKIKKCTNYHFDAPLILIICYDKQQSWKRSCDNKDGGQIDASIIATHMMLETVDLGLGSTWVGSFDPQKLIEQFNIPKNYEPVCILPIGYPSDKAKPNPRHYERKDLTETVFYNSF